MFAKTSKENLEEINRRRSHAFQQQPHKRLCLQIIHIIVCLKCCWCGFETQSEQIKIVNEKR